MLKNTGGTRITLTERKNYLNGGELSTRTSNISIEPGQTHTFATVFCSATSTEKSFRTDWSGSDASGNRVTATGPVLRLLAK